jgi:hypothetical protein
MWQEMVHRMVREYESCRECRETDTVLAGDEEYGREMCLNKN